jgi:adenosylhomocysteine nucleosidase
MDKVSRVALLAPMPSELAPLVKAGRLERHEHDGLRMHRGRVGRTEVLATKIGMGTQLSAAATAQLLDATEVDLVVVVGIAGGIAPAVDVGDLVVPEAVVDAASGAEYEPAALPGHSPQGRLETSDEFHVDDATIATLRGRGVIAVDMETSAVAAVCTERGVAWSVVRAISDMAGVTPDAVVGLAKPDGSPNVGAGVRYMLKNPRQVPQLMRLARDSTRAAKLAALTAVRACERR